MAAALEPFYRVLEAADGREALALFGVVGVEVAAVVTDVRMPDVDGSDAGPSPGPAGAVTGYPVVSGSGASPSCRDQ